MAESARALYRRALAIDPTFQPARQKLGLGREDDASFINTLKVPMSADVRQEWASAKAHFDIDLEAATMERQFALLGIGVDGRRFLRWRPYASLALFGAFLIVFAFIFASAVSAFLESRRVASSVSPARLEITKGSRARPAAREAEDLLDDVRRKGRTHATPSHDVESSSADRAGDKVKKE